jgi:SAM-dependent methyltransferase
MRDEDFEALYRLEDTHWWFAGMRRVADAWVAEALARPRLRILDAGCGVGWNLRHYGLRGHDAFGFDVAPAAIARARRLGLTAIAFGSVTAIPFQSGLFDVVFSFDVLEQLAVDDVPRAFAEMARVLKPGGTLFVRAPAFEWLHSSHDTVIGSVRRYTAPELERMARGAGLERVRTAYANAFLFPVAVATRLLKRIGIGGGSDVRPLPLNRILNPVLREILAGEAVLALKGIRLPIGLSAVCVARKGY